VHKAKKEASVKKIVCPRCGAVNLEKFVTFPHCAGCSALLPLWGDAPARAGASLLRRPLRVGFWMSLVGLALAQARGTKYADEVARDFQSLCEMPDAVAQTLLRMDPVRKLGREIADSKAVLFLGRHVGFPVALEGALKLKELAYMHAEGFAGGELKHGPIALIEEGLPVVVVTPSPRSQPLLHAKMLSNIREIQARGARTIVIGEDGDDTVAPFADFLLELPRVPALLQPLVATVPLQILAAEIARTRGYDIDKPRNLAKSVTVE